MDGNKRQSIKVKNFIFDGKIYPTMDSANILDSTNPDISKVDHLNPCLFPVQNTTENIEYFLTPEET